MPYDFDRIIDRRHTDSVKWSRYDEDVLSLWIADTDFAVPPPVLRAVRERVAHPIFGYGQPPEELREVIQERLARLYRWRVELDDILFLPGVVCGFNLACRAFAAPGGQVLVEPPVYPPMLSAARNAGCGRKLVPLVEGRERYEHDLDRFEEAVAKHADDGCPVSLFLLCNPHNPVGRVFEAAELERLAEICLRHDVVICSDEIHCDFVYAGHDHVPIASLSPEVGAQTITLFAPSKTYSIAGLRCSIGVIQNPDLRARMLEQTGAGLIPGVNVLGYVAALAAYREAQPWLDELLVYLETNRDYVLEYVEAYLPGVRCKRPEGTFLAWLDCREAGIPGDPHRFFLDRARVALNDGSAFGPKGGAVPSVQDFVRLNFGCPRAILTQALERMRIALEELS